MKEKIEIILRLLLWGIIYFGMMWLILFRANFEDVKILVLTLWFIGFPSFINNFEKDFMKNK